MTGHLAEWIAGGLGVITLALITYFLGQNSKLFERFDALATQFKDEMSELKLQIASGYVRRDECASAMDANRAGHSDQWEKINETRETLSRLEGKISAKNGNGGHA